MAVGLRRRKKSSFVQIENSMFKDERLSWKAKGLLGYMLGRPDEWIIREVDLINRSTEGQFAVRAAIKELEKFNYLRKWQKRKDKGLFGELVWIYDDVPLSDDEIESFMKENDIYTRKPSFKNQTTDSNRRLEDRRLETGQRENGRPKTGRLNNKEFNNTDFINKDINNKSLSEKKKIEQFADDLAKRNGKTPVTYKKALLKDWEREGLKTLDAVKLYVGDIGDKNIRRKEMIPDYMKEQTESIKAAQSPEDIEKIKRMRELQSKVLDFK